MSLVGGQPGVPAPLPPSIQMMPRLSVSSKADRSLRGIQKGRKIVRSSSSGNRAWTEEEEAYVLQARYNKTPYKKIAADLNKTELACRLHYHQMSYGRKKSWGGRTGSTSSSTTSTSHSPEPVCASPYPQFRPPAPSMLPPTNTPQFEVPILPKPRQPSIISPQPLPIEQRSPSLTEGHMGMERPRQHYDVDIERLQRVYDRHRNSFWSVIASEYSIPGAEVPPQVLERAFFDTQCSPTVPPKDQPLSQCSEFSPTQVPQQRSFQQAPVNDLMLTPPADAMSFPDGRMSSATLTNATSFPSSMSSTPTEHTKKCTVSSLLTVERDVWQSKEIKAL